MTFTYAGEYAGDILYRTAGAAAGVQVAVTTSGNAPATLYTDATKDTPLGTNVVTTDSLGNLAFFADPGTYTCTANGSSFPVVLAVNPLESGGAGSGSVTSVAVESANGLAGTVADATSTPQITLSTTATGVLKGASSVIEAATAGTDYLTPSGSGASLTGITAGQVGADASGAAATAQGNAESFATSAVATETSRAEAAEALLAPLASPALTGSPTAPTKTALTSNTDLATTAYADSAVGVEKTRALAAEALLAPLASPALTGSPTAPTKTALTDSTDIATTAYTDAAVAVETTRAEGAESTNATAISAETTRAEAAEALLAPKASPTLTGTPAAPTAAALTDSVQIATTAYADSAVAVETSRAETAEGLKLAKASNLSDLASASTARTNLGLGAAALLATPIPAADLPVLAPLSAYLMPTGATAETFPFRWTSGTPGSASNSVPYLVGIGLPSGLLVSNISFVVNAAAVTVTNGWYALLNSSLSVLAVSAAQGSGQWGSGTVGDAVTLAMGTPVTTAYSGLYYLAVSTTAATNAKFMVSGAWNSAPIQIAPVACGFMSTAQAAPPSLSATLSGTLTGNGGFFMYGYTS